jgi:RNA polymerase sigma factor (sigma-70 family)
MRRRASNSDDPSRPDEGGHLGSMYVAFAGKMRRFLRVRRLYPSSVLSPRSVSVGDMDADDIVQEVFARLCVSLAYKQPTFPRDPGPYLLTSAKNLLIDSLRRRERRAALPLTLDRDSRDAGPTPLSPPTIRSTSAANDDVGDPLLLDAVATCIAALPPHLRSVYDARFVRGLSQQDTAVALGTTRRRVRTWECNLLGTVAKAVDDFRASRF